MDSLAQIYARTVAEGWFCDKGTTHAYIDVYEKLLAPYRETAKRVLEVGIYDGGSLKLFEQYFTNAEVHGIDISLTPLDKVDLKPVIADGTHHIHIMNAADPSQVEKEFKDFEIDVLIEDASHNFIDTQLIHDSFMRLMAPGSIYIVEDIQALEESGWWFKDNGFEIIDLRKERNRYDDVLAVKRAKTDA